MSSLIGQSVGGSVITIAVKTDAYNTGIYGGTSYGSNTYTYNGKTFTKITLTADSTFNNGNYTAYYSNDTSISISTLSNNTNLLYLAVGTNSTTDLVNLQNVTSLQAVYIDRTNYAGTYNIDRGGNNPFRGENCPNLQAIRVNPNNPLIVSIDDILYYKDLTTLICHPAQKQSVSYTAPNTLLKVNERAFEKCSLLQNIKLYYVTTIGSGAFVNVNSLNSITIPSVNSTTLNNAFSGIINPLTVYTKSTNSIVRTYTFPNGSTIINLNNDTTLSTFEINGTSSFNNVIIPLQNGRLTLFNGFIFTAPYGTTSVSIVAIPTNNLTTVTITGDKNFTTGYNPVLITAVAEDSTTVVYTILVNVEAIPCFKEDTKILTINGYVTIQNLRKGDLIKTLKNEYVPINIIGSKIIMNEDSDLIIDKLFVCTNENYPEIFEDLYITGLHSILVDNLTKTQLDNIIKLYDLTDEIYVTDDKYRLPVCYDERAKMYETKGEFKIYHLALDNENEVSNYGIYANGLLVETTSIKLLKESNMTFIE